MVYSKGFERDYEFYLKNLDKFNFCGTLNPSFQAIAGGKMSAKECFFHIESNGKNYPCIDAESLNRLLLTKASVNFQIKQWAEGISDGTLLLFELSIRLWNERCNHEDKLIFDTKTAKNNLVWENGEPVYYADIETQYGFPEWVAIAVLNQAKKTMKNKCLIAA